MHSTRPKKRKPEAMLRSWLTPFRFRDALALVLGVLALFAAAYWYVLQEGEARQIAFEVSRDPAGWRIECMNRTSGEIALYAPWPGEGALSFQGRALGLCLEVGTGGTFQAMALPEGVWEYRGLPAEQQEAVVIPPELSDAVTLDQAALSSLAPEADHARITAVDNKGRKLFRQEIPLPNAP